ncbi:hypothetical protein VTN49DRAFT_3446 [Thermomyces lanuginosus]|uniref:uncharacterized protein n=1 Tax=Thermomyces lanuginosus TaxID=5541 RepID=UPI003742E7FD
MSEPGEVVEDSTVPEIWDQAKRGHDRENRWASRLTSFKLSISGLIVIIMIQRSNPYFSPVSSIMSQQTNQESNSRVEEMKSNCQSTYYAAFPGKRRPTLAPINCMSTPQ